MQRRIVSGRNIWGISFFNSIKVDFLSVQPVLSETTKVKLVLLIKGVLNSADVLPLLHK